MATIDVTQETFESVVTGGGIVVIDFWAPWCGPCKSFAPVFEAAAAQHADVVFAKVNTDEQQALAGHFAIRSIPTLMIFREGILIFQQPGALPAAGLESVIAQARALDMDAVRQDIAGQAEERAS